MAGHIRTRTQQDGTRSYQARHPGPRGKTVVRTFPRKRDAERWLQAQGTAMATGEWLDPALGKRTFAALAEQWTATRATQHSPRTRARNQGILRTYLLPEWGTTPLARLDRPAIKAYFAQHPFPSPATARKVHTTLSSILTEGVELGWLRTNPAARLRLPTQPKADMTVLTAQEVRQLAQAMPAPQDRLAVLVAAYTGVRAGELWALRKEDLVLAPTEDARVLVRRTLTRDDDGTLLFRPTTKTGKPRVVSLPAFLARELQSHTRTLQPADLLFSSPGGGNRRKAGDRTPIRHELWMQRVWRPVVHGTPARPATPRTRGRAAQPARPAVPSPIPGKAHLRFHDLRHTCASLLISNGASIMLVSQRLGHASTRMTLDRYSWLYPSEEAAMAVALDAVWQAAPADLDAARQGKATGS